MTADEQVAVVESEVECWVPIAGREQYDVSNWGRVRSWKNGHGSPNTGNGGR